MGWDETVDRKDGREGRDWREGWRKGGRDGRREREVRGRRQRKC